ncbi:TonB-dependent receptor [Candidatus Thioglobus sp.]|nr:TonB-dependent receptor [Candidatus Thioglobus sp.]
MKFKQLSVVAVSLLTFTSATNAVLGPIPIYLNTEYRTENPVIGSIASTLSFNADDIKATGANTFLDFLATIPSVGLVNPQGNVPAVFLRGNEARHTLVLVDGVSVNDISSPDAAVGYGLKVIPLNDIEKIDIIKGYGSVLYGASAIGGVISVTTKKATEGNAATVGTKFGTNNSKTYSLSASTGGKNGYIRLTQNKHSTDGINARTDFSAGEKDSISNSATQIKFGNEKFHASYLESTNKTDFDKCYLPDMSTVDNCVADRKLNKIAISTNKQINEVWKTKLYLAQTTTDVTTYDGGVASIYSSDDYKSTDLILINDIKVNNGLFNIGLSKVDKENTTDKLKFSNKDIFINWQKNINDIDVNTGIRHIKHDNFGTHTIYNAGIGKYLDDSVKLTVNYNTAFNAPSLDHLSDSDNPAKLKPETSKNINIGLNKKYVWGEANVELYKNIVTDVITYTDNGGWPNPDFYTNKNKLTNKGVELSINTDILDYDIELNHHYVESRMNNRNIQSTRRPKNTTNLAVKKQYGKFNSIIQVIKKSSSLDTTGGDPTLGDITLSGYTLLNLSTNYNVNNNTKALLNIKNATDRDYMVVDKYNQLGRTIELGLDFNF